MRQAFGFALLAYAAQAKLSQDCIGELTDLADAGKWKCNDGYTVCTKVDDGVREDAGESKDKSVELINLCGDIEAAKAYRNKNFGAVEEEDDECTEEVKDLLDGEKWTCSDDYTACTKVDDGEREDAGVTKDKTTDLIEKCGSVDNAKEVRDSLTSAQAPPTINSSPECISEIKFVADRFTCPEGDYTACETELQDMTEELTRTCGAVPDASCQQVLVAFAQAYTCADADYKSCVPTEGGDAESLTSQYWTACAAEAVEKGKASSDECVARVKNIAENMSCEGDNQYTACNEKEDRTEDLVEKCDVLPIPACAGSAESLAFTFACEGDDWTQCKKPDDEIVYDVTSDLLAVCTFVEGDHEHDHSDSDSDHECIDDENSPSPDSDQCKDELAMLAKYFDCEDAGYTKCKNNGVQQEGVTYEEGEEIDTTTVFDRSGKLAKNCSCAYVASLTAPAGGIDDDQECVDSKDDLSKDSEDCKEELAFIAKYFNCEDAAFTKCKRLDLNEEGVTDVDTTSVVDRNGKLAESCGCAYANSLKQEETEDTATTMTIGAAFLATIAALAF